MEGINDFQIPELWISAFNRGEVKAAATNGLIIDPGHGGTDPGAQGNGIIEKYYNLAVSLYQYKRFQDLGVPVKITRTSDVTIPPSIRAVIVKNSGMKHCLSNHVNAGQGDGAEFIYSKFSSSSWADIAREEMQREGQNVRRIFTRTLNSGADYYFMHRETGAVETIISEYGFLDSGGDDVQQLKSNQIAYAESQVRAYCRYAGFNYKAPGGSSPGIALYKVQAGAFRDIDGAKQRVQELNRAGIEAFYLKDGDLYKVQAGAFGDIDGAKARVESIQRAGFEAFYIKE